MNYKKQNGSIDIDVWRIEIWELFHTVYSHYSENILSRKGQHFEKIILIWYLYNAISGLIAISKSLKM